MRLGGILDASWGILGASWTCLKENVEKGRGEWTCWKGFGTQNASKSLKFVFKMQLAFPGVFFTYLL